MGVACRRQVALKPCLTKDWTDSDTIKMNWSIAMTKNGVIRNNLNAHLLYIVSMVALNMMVVQIQCHALSLSGSFLSKVFKGGDVVGGTRNG